MKLRRAYAVVPLLAAVLCTAFLWSAHRGGSTSAATGSHANEPSESQEYMAYFRDCIYWRLHITESDPGNYASWENGREFDRLIELMSTIRPESWDKNCSVEKFDFERGANPESAH